MNQSPLSFSRRAFSLMELIVVIAIIGVIATYVVPQASQILKGSVVTQASTILTDQLRLAREFAVTKNSKVEVRFYQYADPETPGEVLTNPASGQYRAMQVFQVLNVTRVMSAGSGNVAGEVTVPLDKLQMLPQGVIMNPSVTYSTLLNNPNSPSIPGTSEPTGLQLPRGVGLKYNYISFRFLQDGSTNLAPVTTVGLPPPPWFMTIHSMTDKGYLQNGMPFNFFCIELDPVVGTTKAFRPQAG